MLRVLAILCALDYEQQDEMEDLHLKEIIRNYLKGGSTPDEHLRVRELMQTTEGRQLFDEVLNELSLPEDGGHISNAEMDHLYSRFEQRLVEEKNSPRLYLPYAKFLRIAAVWLMICTAGYYGWKQWTTKMQSPVVAMRKSTTANGKMVEIFLTDGTRVLMNSASTLRYPEKFSGKTREIYLHGEAFFKVSHDPVHPFIVHTKDLNVHVLGTSFNVSAYQEDQLASVTVSSGKVGVIGEKIRDKNTQMLLPGDQLILDNKTGTYTQIKVDPDESKSWQLGKLMFSKETLENITRKLTRRYDVSFTFKNEVLMKKRFDLNQRNESLDDVMKVLSIAGDFNYRISGKRVEVW